MELRSSRCGPRPCERPEAPWLDFEDPQRSNTADYAHVGRPVATARTMLAPIAATAAVVTPRRPPSACPGDPWPLLLHLVSSCPGPSLLPARQWEVCLAIPPAHLPPLPLRRLFPTFSEQSLRGLAVAVLRLRYRACSPLMIDDCHGSDRVGPWTRTWTCPKMSPSRAAPSGPLYRIRSCPDGFGVLLFPIRKVLRR